MASACGRWVLVFNGELYNYRELRAQLTSYPFSSQSDTEVVLAAWSQWGEAALDRFLGMFAFAVWDTDRRELVAVRDRFGVKPLHYRAVGEGLLLASEIKALVETDRPASPDVSTWASYLAHGRYEGPRRTFWEGIEQVPAGHLLRWREGRHEVACWYDIASRIGLKTDERPTEEVIEEYLSLLDESLALRFRADVPVGINISGGLDSSLLIALVRRMQGSAAQVRAYSFATGDSRYDETPWVRQMLSETEHELRLCHLSAEEVPALTESVQEVQDEPFGGVPTLAYARLFERARADGTIVLLDGQGMDEQWAGYDYYRRVAADRLAVPVQGSNEPATRPAALTSAFAELAQTQPAREPFPDALRNRQLRDLTLTKLPRALRFNDRVSMRSSTELREPFLDHRLVELALRQPASRKVSEETGKVLLREIAGRLVPPDVRYAPKRPLQTPQREWIRGPLRGWVESHIDRVLEGALTKQWFQADVVRREWKRFLAGESDNSFYVWQWISASLLL